MSDRAARRRRLARRFGTLAREPRRIGPAVRRRVRSPLVPAADRTKARKPAPAPPDPQPAQLTRGERANLITAGYDLRSGVGLEIGPSHNPLLRKTEGYDIRIADHLDQAGLIAKYADLDSDRIEEVDYVLAPGRMTEFIPGQFDYIVASHVAEHTVDLIAFLQDCQALLKPGGVLGLALPDKRYCFDRFRERSGLGRVIDVHRAAPPVHTPGMVTEHFAYSISKAGRPAWYAGAPGDYAILYGADHVRELKELSEAGAYIDTHNWVLTPNHFRLLIHDLRALGFIQLHESAFTDTIDHEFFVTLAHEPGPTPPTREQLFELSAREVLQFDRPTLE